MSTQDLTKAYVIILHGLNGNPTKLESLKETVLGCYPNAKVVIPQLPLGVFSAAKIDSIVSKVIETIVSDWTTLREFEGEPRKIILIGHSIGANIIRKVYLDACDRYFIEKNVSHMWVENVDRLLFFASVNNGWVLNSHFNFLYGYLLKIIEKFVNVGVFLGIKPILYEFRRGSTFINELKLQSLRLNEQGYGNALTIQLLGTQDELVSPDASIDLVTGKHFIYLDMPLSNHKNVTQLNEPLGDQRKVVVVKALLWDKTHLKTLEVLPTDDNYIMQDKEVTDVVFVIHGIRDTGYWTLKLANKVKSLGEKQLGKKFRTETSSYGYFPIGSFLFRKFRSAKVEWFIDRYIENRAYYPNAKFSFVGHSHGTYLLARALQDYPGCEFKNIVLAGSVIKEDYNWETLISTKRVEKIYNFVANNDWVVGIFPKTFQTFGIQDLGSAGYDGFSLVDNKSQFKFIAGGHGAAVRENVWDEVAYVAVNGTLSENNSIPYKTRSLFMKSIGWIAPLLVIGLIVGLIAIGFWVYNSTLDLNYKIVILTIYAFIIYKGLTKL